MALIAMAVYSTEENKKDDCLRKTLSSLKETVDFSKHRLMLSVNAYTPLTKSIIDLYSDIITLTLWNDENLGTAEAINKVWKKRYEGESVIKMDDDVVFYHNWWIDLMEEAIQKDKNIGIIGLKRRDLIQTTWHQDPHFRSELIMLPHEAGQRWTYVEKTGDIMGTCTMYNTLLLEKIGYLQQIDKYGYDDNLACHRSHLAGFYNCFLIGVDIEHIDEGGTPYQDWKHKHSGQCTQRYIQFVQNMIQGKQSIYYNPFSNAEN